MKRLLNVYKPSGLTPLQVIHAVRKHQPELQNEKIGYAGRLDPLAHGVLLLMVGAETTKQKDLYLHLPKTYEFEMLFGFSTDTYDALGLLQTENCHPEFISGSSKREMLKQVQHDIEDFIQAKLGKQIQSYPPFSSKTVNGKPLHWWAKNNKLTEIAIPEREIEIFEFKLLSTNELATKHVQTIIFKQIDSVGGDFRQKDIKEKWQTFFRNTKQKQFQTVRFTLSCSSGTYVRSLVNDLGQTFNCGAITLEILRTKVGEYDLKDSLKYV